MTAIRSSKLVGPLSLALVALMLTVALPTSVLPTAAAQTQNRLLLLFPVLDQSGSEYEDVAPRATDYLQMALSSVAGLRVVEFSRTSPMVLRAVQEGQIRPIDLDTEVTDPVSALQMGYALGADEVCLASVLSVETKAEPIAVEVLLNGQCYDVHANVDPTTAQVVERPTPSSTFGVNGKSREREGYEGSLPPLVREALRDAADKAARVLAGVPAEEMAEQPAKHKGKGTRWALALAVIAGLVLAAANSDDDDEGPAANAVPPVPLRLEIEPAAIRLYWAPPNTTLTVLRYDLQRSTDNGATWNTVPGSQGVVEADDTSFADHYVQAGVSYRYRIRAQYTTTGPSAYAEFDAVVFPG